MPSEVSGEAFGHEREVFCARGGGFKSRWAGYEDGQCRLGLFDISLYRLILACACWSQLVSVDINLSLLVSVLDSWFQLVPVGLSSGLLMSVARVSAGCLR